MSEKNKDRLFIAYANYSLRVDPKNFFKYGRTVARIYADKILLNEELIKAGLGWVYWQYCHHPICETWKGLQIGARMDKCGLWADPDPIPPWEFRRKKGQ